VSVGIRMHAGKTTRCTRIIDTHARVGDCRVHRTEEWFSQCSVLTHQHHEDRGEEECLARGLPVQRAVRRDRIVVLLAAIAVHVMRRIYTPQSCVDSPNTTKVESGRSLNMDVIFDVCPFFPDDSIVSQLYS
jgi:predicted methyltransferase